MVVRLGRLVTNGQIVSLFAFEDFSCRFAADVGFNGVLNIRDVESVTSWLCRGSTSTFRFGWPITRKESQILNAWDFLHDADNLVAFAFQLFEI